MEQDKQVRSFEFKTEHRQSAWGDFDWGSSKESILAWRGVPRKSTLRPTDVWQTWGFNFTGLRTVR